MESAVQKMKALVSDRHFAVYDPQFTKALLNLPWSEWHKEERPFFCREEYLDTFRQWINASKLNHIAGLERFKEYHLINGTTQSFDEAYYTHKERRLRVFRGEYAYHRRVVKNNAFLDDAPLEGNDFVIVSAPFCSTGDVHPKFYSLLEEAEALGVPVIVDAAYFGTCTDFQLNVDHPAIESVSFSLSKGAGLGDVRSGIRFSNIKDENPICQQNQYNHSVLAAARIGIYMMKQFSADHIPERFRAIQEEVCREIGVLPTKCIHLALGGKEWDHLKKDEAYNVLGIRELIKARYKKLL